VFAVKQLYNTVYNHLFATLNLMINQTEEEPYLRPGSLCRFRVFPYRVTKINSINVANFMIYTLCCISFNSSRPTEPSM